MNQKNYYLYINTLKNRGLEKLTDLWDRRELIRYFVHTDLKRIYSNKVLGFFWTLLDPLMMMLVYTVLVVFIFKRGETQFPILLFAALLSWRWFTFSVAGAIKSITGKVKLIQTTRFPITILPLSRVLVGMVNYLFGLFTLVPLLFLFEAKITVNILWMPLLILIQLLFTLGFTFICSIVGIYFRDIENILQFSLRMWFYLSPGLYSARDRIPLHLLKFYMLNPFSALFESYKNVLVRGIAPDDYIWVAFPVSAAIFLLGWSLLSYKEAELAKIL